MDHQQEKLIVVTGGAGFIGSAVIRHLNNSGIANIVVVDDLKKTEKWKNLVGKDFAEFISKEQIFDWLASRTSQVGAFIHLGACTSTVETDASYLLENNTRFSMRLAEYALKHGQRFIYASSAATYGDGQLGFSDDHTLLQNYHPLNMYGYSKHLFDLWALKQKILNRFVGLKYFNVFGPNEAHKGRMASAITHILPVAQQEGVIRLFKSSEPLLYRDGGQKRDFIYVKDVARMTCAFLDNQATGIFNIGTGSAGTWNEIAHAVFKAIGKNPQIDYIDMPKDLLGKYQNYTCANMEKTRSILKEQANTTPLENAVVDYVQNYLLPGKTW